MELQPRRRHIRTSKNCTTKTFDKRVRQFVTNIMLCTKKSTNGSRFQRTTLEGRQLSIKMMLFTKFLTIWINAECGLKKTSTSCSARSWTNSWLTDLLRARVQSQNARTKMREAISVTNAVVSLTRLTWSILVVNLLAALP